MARLERASGFSKEARGVSQGSARIHARRAMSRKANGSNDPDLEWLLWQGASALGLRGTISGVISQCERGSVGGCGSLGEDGCYRHPYTDQQLGTGPCSSGDVERYRWLFGAWSSMSFVSRNVLLVHYEPVRAELRSDEGYGARDRWVIGSDNALGHHGQTRTGVESRLGEFAALAFALAKDPARLLIACREPEPIRKGRVNQEEAKRRRQVVASAINTSREASEKAHAEWFSCKEKAAPMRKTSQRRKVLPAHQTGTDAE